MIAFADDRVMTSRGCCGSLLRWAVVEVVGATLGPVRSGQQETDVKQYEMFGRSVEVV
jgi:hypothetical protein